MKRQTKTKKRAREKAKMIGDDKQDPPDFISKLPNDVLYIILSKLPIDDAVRSSTLAKSWRYLWKQTSNLIFDVEHMLEPNFTRGGKRLQYVTLFFFILEQHLANLTTCSFLHFPDIDLRTWIQHLFEIKKGIKDLTLACEPIYSVVKYPFPSTVSVMNSFSSLTSLELICYYLESPSIFESCKNLITLKLKDIHMQDETINGILTSCKSLENFSLSNSIGFTTINIQNPNLKFLELKFLYTDYIVVVAESLEVVVLASITCPVKNLVLVVPNLREFNCCNNQKIPTLFPVLGTQELMEEYSGFLESERKNIFWNLSSLSVDLNVKDMKEAVLLSYILRSSVDLQTLRILAPVSKTTTLRVHHIAGGPWPYACSTFWEGRETCNCVLFKLKFVYIEGFRGMEAEVSFIKHLITRYTKIKKITIVCSSSSMEDLYDELLSVPSASTDLSIQLKVVDDE